MIKQNGTTTPDANSGAKAGLFVSVKTFSAEGKTIGERVVDMYHYGTRNWLQNHHWWAMHNGHCVETTVATEAEVTAYIDQSKAALAAKFNGDNTTAGTETIAEPVIEPIVAEKAAPAKKVKVAA